MARYWLSTTVTARLHYCDCTSAAPDEKVDSYSPLAEQDNNDQWLLWKPSARAPCSQVMPCVDTVGHRTLCIIILFMAGRYLYSLFWMRIDWINFSQNGHEASSDIICTKAPGVTQRAQPRDLKRLVVSLQKFLSIDIRLWIHGCCSFTSLEGTWVV